MRLLLDTHSILWWLSDDRRLSRTARDAIADPDNEPVASVVAGYEIAYKQNLGRLPSVPSNLRDRLAREGFEILSLSLDHALAAAALPGPHRDPWDRIMMAQAHIEGLTIVTVDRVFSRYGVPVLW